MAYPILQGQTRESHEARRNGADYPKTVPFELVKDNEKQAQSNHSQSLARLAERGGLSPMELWCVVNNLGFYEAIKQGMSESKAIEWLRSVKGVSWGPA